jgi:hypothetical protein
VIGAMEALASQFWGVGLVVAAIAALVLFWGFARRPDFIRLPRSRRFRRVIAPGLTVAVAVGRLRRLGRPYQLYQVDEARGVLVVMDGPTLISLGNFYPLYIDPTVQGVQVQCSVVPKIPIPGLTGARRLATIQRAVAHALDGIAI